VPASSSSTAGHLVPTERAAELVELLLAHAAASA
jgi:predicted phage gp36 major capsid-like protein